MSGRFSKIDIKVSPPLVSFRETIVVPPKLDKVNEVGTAPRLYDKIIGAPYSVTLLEQLVTT